MSINFAEFLTVSQAARDAKLTDRRIRSFIADGRIKAQSWAGSYLIPRDEWARFKALVRQPGNPNFTRKTRAKSEK